MMLCSNTQGGDANVFCESSLPVSTNARRQQHLQLAGVSRKLSVVPRGLAQLKYHSDAITFMPVKALCGSSRSTRVRALPSALQAASSQRFAQID
jgi:hypothetical protein